MKRNSRGFTLVEILIVVIILGILAAIVIPQFTNASSQAKSSSVSSTLQTIRSQIELFKIQHNDTPPQFSGAAASLWSILTTQSNTTDTNVTVGSGTAFGPYLQTSPMNPSNNWSTIGAAAAANIGWVYTTAAGGAYSIKATDSTGTVLLSY